MSKIVHDNRLDTSKYSGPVQFANLNVSTNPPAAYFNPGNLVYDIPTASLWYGDGVSWKPVGGAGTGTVTNITTGYGITGGPITTTGTLSSSLLASTRYADQAITFPAGDIMQFPNIVENFLETSGSITYAAGVYTINVGGLYKISITTCHNGASTLNVPIFIRKNADPVIYRCSTGNTASALSISLSLFAADTITITTTDTAITTPVAGFTNFVTIERLN